MFPTTPIAASPPPPPSTSFAANSLSSGRHLLTFDRAASLLDRCDSLDRALQIHAALLRHHLHHHPVLSFKLLRSYSSLGHLDHARIVFDSSPSPSVFSWCALLHAYSLHHLPTQALRLFRHVLSTTPLLPNAFILSCALKSCSLSDLPSFHSLALKLSLDSDPFVRTAFLDAYARGGDSASACRLFDTMPRGNLVGSTVMLSCHAAAGDLPRARRLFDQIHPRDAACWNAMIGAYAQHGRPLEALDLFRQMLLSGPRPSEPTLVSVLGACAQIGALESGKWLHSFANSRRIPMSLRLRTALIDMYSKCGSLEDARLVFDEIPERDRDAIAWNAMIAGCAMHGRSRNALHLFSQLCASGLRPTDITFIGVLSACSHAGLVAEGREFFHLMRDEYGIEPKIEHYGCMVDLLGRAGFVEEAYELVESMDIEPDPVLWGSLLGACRLHSNKALGKKIAELLLARGLANSGTYILLSNMYAAEGRWDEVACVRTLMKDTGLHKEPGCSSIEVDNKTHEFVPGDVNHPRSKEIYLMLEELGGLLKAHGYVPRTNAVLHDIEELD